MAPALEGIAWAFFVIGYPIVLLPYGLNFTDGPWHYLAFAGISAPDSLTFLYSSIGSGWRHMAGDSIIAYRAFAAVLNVLTHALPVLLILWNDAARRQTFSLILVGVVLGTALNFYNLAYDVLSRFVLAIILVNVHFYIQRGGWKQIVFLSLLTAAITAIRFSSVVVSIPLQIVIIASGVIRKEKAPKVVARWGTYVTLSIIIYGFLAFCHRTEHGVFTENGFALSVYAFVDQIRQTLQGVGSTHSFSSMINAYLLHAVPIIGYFFALAAFWAVLWYLIQSNRHIAWTLATIIAFGWFYFKFVSDSAYMSQLSFLLSGLAFVLTGYLSFISVLRRDYPLLLFYFFAVTTGFVSIAGSNTGLLKLGMTYSFVLPVLLFLAAKQLPGPGRKSLYAIIAVICMCSFVDKVFISETYQDGAVPELNATVDHGKLYGIKTSSARKHQIEQVIGRVNEIRQSEPNASILFYGAKSWLYRYLTDGGKIGKHYYARNYFDQGFYMGYHDAHEAERLNAYLKHAEPKPYIFLVYDYPEMDSVMDSGVIGEVLKTHYYHLINQGQNYEIYGAHLR